MGKKITCFLVGLMIAMGIVGCGDPNTNKTEDADNEPDEITVKNVVRDAVYEDIFSSGGWTEDRVEIREIKNINTDESNDVIGLSEAVYSIYSFDDLELVFGTDHAELDNYFKVELEYNINDDPKQEISYKVVSVDEMKSEEGRKIFDVK